MGRNRPREKGTPPPPSSQASLPNTWQALPPPRTAGGKVGSGTRPLTQGVWDEVQEGVSQEAPRSKAEQQLKEGLVLGGLGLHRDQEEDEVRGSADEEGGPNGLQESGGREECF